MYEMKARVRFSEVDRAGRLSVGSLINYLQDCCSFHSEDCGYPLKRLQAEHTGWFLMTWQIRIHALPRMGEQITVKTAPVSYRGLLAERLFLLEDAAGETLAEANSFWVFMDLKAQKPVRLSDEMKEAYGACEALPGEWLGRKLPVPAAPKEIGRFTAGPLDVDTNHHMNNERYVTAVLSLLPEEKAVREIRVEYRNQVRAGDTVIVSQDEDAYVLTSPAGTVYAVMELLS